MNARPVLLALVAVAGLVAGGSATTGPATAAGPGGVFVTGHDPDFHSIAGNTSGARSILRRAVAYVTSDAPAPRLLVVSSRIAPPAGHLDTVQGVLQAGFAGFDVAAVGTPAPVLDLATVDFGDYDAVLVGSDFGGLLRQAELDVLNARSQDLIDFVNGGGGLVALAESNGGAHLTPSGGHFDFLPFLATEVRLDQVETGVTVTPLGSTIGLTAADVNGNVSHNVFTSVGGFQVVDMDSAGRPLSLAVRGQRICPGGVPSLSVGDVTLVEGTGGTTLVSVPVVLDVAPCGAPVEVEFTTSDSTAVAPGDYAPVSGTLTFPDGVTARTITVPVVADAAFEPDEQLYVGLSEAVNASVADAQGVVTLTNDDDPNGAPDCSGVGLGVDELWPPDHTMRRLVLTGATDPDGDAVALRVTGVTQDEPLDDRGDGQTTPDAALVPDQPAAVDLRAERDGRGDGRVYRVAFTGDDGAATCSGTVLVGVRHARPVAPVDSGTSYDSLG